MLTESQDRARRAFLHFQAELLTFEEAMQPLRPEMSIECAFELDMMGRIARSFFRMANQEVFSRVAEKVKIER